MHYVQKENVCVPETRKGDEILAKDKKQKRISPAKQRIIDNYEEQRKYYLEDGYEERQEVISVARANTMALVTAGPVAILCAVIWIFTAGEREGTFDFVSIIWACVVCFACIIIHELLHGVGWALWTKEGWKSIYLGVMWEYLTPYCHCREPLRPKQYLAGGLLPFAVLGIGIYLIALFTGNGLLLLLSLINILSAGGDTTIACMEWKYLKQNESCYILDHPTDCGFVAFVLRSNEPHSA